MPTVARVTIHPSQFPEQVRRKLIESLRARRVNHKFHYDSIKQTQKWLALHEAYSPARTDANCAATYDAAFSATAKLLAAPEIHLIGLGCGGGQKDARLIELLQIANRRVIYTPSDVSVAMVLVARHAVSALVSESDCHPLVCDLATADDIAAVLEQHGVASAARLITFFGMIPNFEPQIILPRLAGIVRPQDYLLFSANLAPGADYAEGVRRVLPLYDNPLTREWLLIFLHDLGVTNDDGKIHFIIEESDNRLRRIRADFQFSRQCKIRVDGESFEFLAGEKMRLFFSYRHTPALIRSMLSDHGLSVMEQWITESGEEGVFLCRPD